MSGGRTPLANGLLFGLIVGLFGGSFWALLFSVVPDEALIASRWLLIGGGLLFWFLVGFLVGVFNAPSLASKLNRRSRTRFSVVRGMLTGIGWFLYRLIVGYFVGAIATTTLSLVGFALPFAGIRLLFDLDKVPKDSPAVDAFTSSMMASIFCGLSGGVFGALIGTRWSPFHRPAIGSRAARSSFLAFLFGVPFGASLGWLPPETETRIFVPLIASVPIGVLSGILGGLWVDIRNLRRAWNDSTQEGKAISSSSGASKSGAMRNSALR